VCDSTDLFVASYAGGYCELHIPGRYAQLLDALRAESNATCEREGQPSPKEPQQSDREDQPDICGITFDQLDFRQIFSFNLDHLIFKLRQCTPDLVCETFGSSPGCDLAEIIEEIYYYYISFGGLYDELFHLLQTKEQWCGPLACMEYGSAKANLDATKKFVSLIIDLANINAQVYAPIVKHYCTTLFKLEIGVGIEKCICELSPFTGAACGACLSKAKIPRLPAVCENLLSDKEQRTIISETSGGYRDQNKRTHSCRVYAEDDCIKRYCPEKSAICVRKNEQLIQECFNQQRCNNPCPSPSNQSQCCSPNEGCYQHKCEAKLGCKNCSGSQRCVPTNTYPYYGCRNGFTNVSALSKRP
jgi:hypothetical protein